MVIRVLGARVRSLREHRDLTQGQLAYRADTTSAQISRLENNERPGAQAILVGRIAAALGTSTDYLLGMTDDPTPRKNPSRRDDDPALILMRQDLAERVARLPEARQRVVMDAFLLLLEAETIADAVKETSILP